MEVIENVLGRGSLYVRKNKIGDVSYDLIVFKRGTEPGIVGRLSCSLECLVKLHQTPRLILHLVDGRQLKIVISRVDFRTETADFKASGWFF
ncbi:MAG TPA: hypothetical protein PLP42_16030 [Acidobacteriota bacterium]|jgi:hypothetical protein|nr:hypothetical protein [Acidobacteriota bacterium]